MKDNYFVYGGWFLLFIVFVLDTSLLVCYHDDKERLNKQIKEKEMEISELKNRIWYAEQMTYIIENKCGGDKNEYR